MAGEVWTHRRILEWTTGYLERKGDEHPRLSAEWLLSNATGHSRVELYMNYDRPLAEAELGLMREGVRRRGAGEPLQYVTGEMPFRHLVLRCERGVLIPRPETEVLVDVALKGVDAAIARGEVYEDAEEHAQERLMSEEGETSFAGEDQRAEAIGDEESEAAATLDDAVREALPKGPRVLEVGCGTGCIALSIAWERRGTCVWATDLSEQAVLLATRNRDALDLGDYVRIRVSDLMEEVPDSLKGTFSVLVSNPPYIPSAVVPTLPFEVQGFEPRLALDGGEDGLDVFRRLLEAAPVYLTPRGMLAVELFEDNVHIAAELVRAQGGWERVEVVEDLTHRPRVLVAVRAG